MTLYFLVTSKLLNSIFLLNSLAHVNSFSDKKPFFGKSSSESSSAAALRQYLPYSAAAAAVSACSPGSSSATSTASHQSPKHFETSDHSVRKKYTACYRCSKFPGNPFLHLQKFTPPGDKSGPIKSEPGLTSSSLYSSHYHRYYTTV